MASDRVVPREAAPGIAVFGSSEPRPGDSLYETARRLGALLAGARFVVVTGGYGGVMEGASHGAREAGGRTLGITCTTFAARDPNPYLTDEVRADDLHDRTRELIERAQDFLAVFGLDDLQDEIASSLPYGLQRRLEIARALATEPALQNLDRRKATDTLYDYIHALRSDGEHSKRILHNKVGRMAGDHKRARTLMRVAYLIIAADGEIRDAERDEFARLCRLLGLEPAQVWAELAK